MSEKGILSKSIASNISEAIIDKLGGTGYTPTEWSKNINLLGIASEDIEEALASITEDTSSTEKGLLSLSVASDMGAILNKKYNTSRGFKPSEVSSAVSALIPLPEKTTSSASIVTFSDGADDVPTKSLIVTIPPTLSGFSSVTETQTGRNLLNGEDAVKTANNIRFYSSAGKYYLAGTYTLSISENVTGLYIRNVSTSTNIATKYNSNFITFTLTEKTLIGFDFYKVGINQNDNVMLEVGSTASTFEPYTPTQYTANLGRTIYGGTPDIVNGTGTDVWCEPLTFTGASRENWSWGQNGGYYRANITVQNIAYTVGSRSECFCNLGTYKASGNDYNTCFIYGNPTSAQFFFYPPQGIESLADFKTWLSSNNLKMTALKATPTDFTFTGQEVPTRLGYNAFWSDEGDTEVTYRADLDLYEAPSMLLEANNTETEGNEEQEVNE